MHKGEIDVNDESRATKPKQDDRDLSAYSDEELQVMRGAIEKEIGTRQMQRTREARQKMQEIAKSVGMTPEELLGLSPTGGRRRRVKRTAGAAVRHPDDPTLVYHGGRKPAWLKRLKEEGREPVKVE
jgi:DNA-binding protein H-NS